MGEKSAGNVMKVSPGSEISPGESGFWGLFCQHRVNRGLGAGCVVFNAAANNTDRADQCAVFAGDGQATTDGQQTGQGAELGFISDIGLDIGGGHAPRQ